jgi:hypothetical protein
MDYDRPTSERLDERRLSSLLGHSAFSLGIAVLHRFGISRSGWTFQTPREPDDGAIENRPPMRDCRYAEQR